MALELLELDIALAVNPSRNTGETGDEFRRLETDAHLVSVILAADGRPVNS
jgi:hypothetical protein